jgi:hypothetical protein
VIPERPAGTDGWSEEQLAALVTRDSMIGTGLAVAPASNAFTPLTSDGEGAAAVTPKEAP